MVVIVTVGTDSAARTTAEATSAPTIGVSRRVALTIFRTSEGFMFQPWASAFPLVRKPSPKWLKDVHRGLQCPARGGRWAFATARGLLSFVQ